MKTHLSGKQINDWANNNNISELPEYWNNSYEWSDKYCRYTKRVKGEFIAKKYKSILSIIEEMKAKVKVTSDTIFITYPNGDIKINRDILTDTFLLPALTN